MQPNSARDRLVATDGRSSVYQRPDGSTYSERVAEPDRETCRTCNGARTVHRFDGPRRVLAWCQTCNGAGTVPA